MSTKNVILLRAKDLVAVAVQDVEAGETVNITGAHSEQKTILATEKIPMGHKIALNDYPFGTHIIKYGLSIGITKKDVKRGQWIHSHNLATGLRSTIEYSKPTAQPAWEEGERLKKLALDPKVGLPKTFRGWRRKDGSVGIRNELWVIPVVGCINKGAENLAEFGRHELGVDAFCFTHPYGCSQLGDDLVNTKLVLSALAKHPNAGAVLVVSLGCENLRPEMFKQALGNYDPEKFRFLNMQESKDDIAEGRALMTELATYLKAQKAEDIPIQELVIGLKCGGSDGFSGISANPLVGKVTELLVALGGSAVQTEVPEMFGAETELMARSCSTEVFDAQVKMINDFKNYFTSHGQEVYENPSPGNRDGGITTLEEKSLGCIRKSGSTPVNDVKPYATPRTVRGLTLLSGPGNDIVSTTNLSAAGCHVILFTTGRGTPFGAPVPTLKIASNSPLAERKPAWIDYNAGVLLEGKSFDDAGIELLKLVIETANGKKTKAELSGNRDMAIFKDGVIL